MDGNAGPSHSQPHAGAGSQIRSRVTVVCAECKRLKLKCDRRTPCSSCLKRDTVPRCMYSAAAAEKIDVQSLHNRVLVLESQLGQLTSGRMKLLSHDLDHALIALGASGSSVLVPLDDIAGVWLDHLDLGRDSTVELQPACLGVPSTSESHEKRQGTRPGGPSPSGSVQGSPQLPSHAASAVFPALFSQLYGMSPPCVTPALLSLLPSAQHRPALLDALNSVLRMHPSLNFPCYRARVDAMFSDGNCPDQIGIGPSRADYSEKPSLSFFAAVAAGFALAIQCSSEPKPSPTMSPYASPSPRSSALPSVSFLLTLSGHVLDLVEDSMSYDLDFLHALVWRCLCLLHDGMPRVSQVVFTTVGKMVNIARLMGLARDPDEFNCGAVAKFSLWDAEMRRRMWWDVFYYDVFISDCMGFNPLISDDQHTCRMPSDVDEDAFVPKSGTIPQPAEQICASNFSYFIQKCKLAQLVKNMKKRVCYDHSASTNIPSTPQDPSLEVASQAEAEVHQYLLDLPPAFRLDVDLDPADPAYNSTPSTLPPSSASETPTPHLIIQRCELFAIAHQLILKLFHPFLRRSNVRPPESAMIASVNACHAIIHASRVAQGVWQRHRGDGAAGRSSNGVGYGMADIPSSHGVFYPFARQLFDAAIVAAHVVIMAPQSVVAKVALDDVRVALDVLRDPTISTGHGRTASRGGVEGCPSEAVAIVEMMLRRAEMAKRSFVPMMAGVKRKLEEVDSGVGKGFWLPYVGGGVAIETTPSGSNEFSSGSATGTPADELGHGSPRSKVPDKTESQAHHQHHPMQARGVASSMPMLKGDKERRFSGVGIRNRGNASDRKSPGGTARRRDSNVSVSQQHGSDSSTYGRSTTSTLSPTSSRVSDVVQESAHETASASYKVEDKQMVDLHVSPTPGYAPRLQPQMQPPQSHSFIATGYHSAGASGPNQHHQAPPYHTGTYGTEPGRPHPTTFYVPYALAPPPQSAARPIGGRGQQVDSHPHGAQQQQHAHAHLEMMGLVVPSRNAIVDASRGTAAKREEEGRESREGEGPVHLASSPPYSGSDGWTEPGVVRFAPPTHWDPGYNY